MIIACDCDNTLNNLQEATIKVFNERYGTKYTMKDFKNYNISECLNKDNAMNFVALYNEPGIYDIVNPLNDAQKALLKLKKDGHDIYIVTNSSPSIFNEKCNWLKFHFNIDEEHIISMKNKWLFKCDLMIEDNIDNLLGGHHYERICVNYPWNRNVRDEVYGIHRCNNWKEIVSVVNKINE